MKFDISRVYTAVNADELPIGSKCYFASDLGMLKILVSKNDDSKTTRLKTIANENLKARFEDHFGMWLLAYLVELPKEKVVKPFETIEEARAVITAHGGFIKNEGSDVCFFVTAYAASCEEKPSIYVSGGWFSLEYISKKFVFADDGSPCGEIVED